MLSNSYGISDYSIFDDAIAVTENLDSTLADFVNTFNSSSSKINDDTLKGPSADLAKDYYEKLVSYFNVMQSDFIKIKDFFNKVLSNYKESDVQASGTIIGSNDYIPFLNLNGSDSSEAAINWALSIADDDSYGYSQNTRWGNPNYDCSSFVISAYEAAGVPVEKAGATYTGNMRSAFESCGFEWIPGDPDVNSLQPGDILLDESDHTEMYIGNGKNVGAHRNYDGVNGDSSGREVCVNDYYSHPWDGVLRQKK